MGEPMTSLSEQFARRNDPPHKPSGILYIAGDADLSYLQSVEWSPARVGWGGRYEGLIAQARQQLPEQGLQDTTWGCDQFGRIVILARETYRRRPAYFVEWPSSLPEEPYPDDAHIVGNDVLDVSQLGERPVYIRYPSGALDLLPVIPDRIWVVPPFKWGYPGTGPDQLASAIEYACCSDIIDKAPRGYLRYARNTLESVIEERKKPGVGKILESVIEKTPTGETLEIRIGQIRGWYAEALVEEQRPWRPWGTDPPP